MAYICLVGLAGSGKSYLAQRIQKMNDGSVIISSDATRAELWGDEATQGDNTVLFKRVTEKIEDAFKAGKTVIYDATNLTAKIRQGMLQIANKYTDTFLCYVVATQYDICLAQNAMRERKVPEYVIERMRKTFTMPQYHEGWTNIEIITRYDFNDYSFIDYQNKIKDFAQDNHHHSMTLGGHTTTVLNNVMKVTDDKLILHAAGLHDNGKLHTKVFHNAKGEPSEMAHYYGHAEVGAYEAIFYLSNTNLHDNEIIWVCGLIQYHMRMYDLKTEKSLEKFLRLVGEEMYADLKILNIADANGH